MDNHVVKSLIFIVLGSKNNIMNTQCRIQTSTIGIWTSLFVELNNDLWSLVISCMDTISTLSLIYFLFFFLPTHVTNESLFLSILSFTIFFIYLPIYVTQFNNNIINIIIINQSINRINQFLLLIIIIYTTNHHMLHDLLTDDLWRNNASIPSGRP